eukprot:2230296-Prymnesium_polylepis.1
MPARTSFSIVLRAWTLGTRRERRDPIRSASPALLVRSIGDSDRSGLRGWRPARVPRPPASPAKRRLRRCTHPGTCGRSEVHGRTATRDAAACVAVPVGRRADRDSSVEIRDDFPTDQPKAK